MSNLPILAAQATGGSGLALFAPVLLIFGVFYFLLILPQQRRQKKWQQMLAELKTGDKVVTSGGLKGTVFAMKEDSITLRRAKGVAAEIAEDGERRSGQTDFWSEGHYVSHE